jgi:golgi phosphoprotein 3
MPIEHELTLPEEVLLLALRDEEGTIPMGSLYVYALGGAILAELVLQGRVSVGQPKRSKLVQLADSRATGDLLLDEAHANIRKAKRRASVATWVHRLSYPSPRDRIAERLVQRGILRRAEGKVLLVFSRSTWPTVDPHPEAEMVERLRRAIFEGERPSVRTAALIGLAHPSGLLSQVFPGRELKHRKKEIAHLVEEVHPADAISEAVREAIAATMVAVQTATMGAVVVAGSAT